MASYLVLNFFYELSFLDFSYLIVKVRHEDVWTGQIIRPTLMGLFSYLLIASLCYVLFEEKKLFLKALYVVFFAIIMVYNISLARRTMILVIVVSLLIWFLFSSIKKPGDLFRYCLMILVSGIFILSIFWFICKFNVFGIWDLISKTSLYHKFAGYGFSSDRIDYLLQGVSLAPKYLWGGRVISDLIGNLLHDLWSDIYDYSGIIPWIIMVIYTISGLIFVTKAVVNKKIDRRFRIMLLTIYSVFIITFCLEPIMTSSSIFMIAYVLIMSLVEKSDSLDAGQSVINECRGGE